MTLLSPASAPPRTYEKPASTLRDELKKQAGMASDPPKKPLLRGDHIAQPNRAPNPKAQLPAVRVAFTVEQWAKCIGLIATGTRVTEAVEQSAINPVELEGFLRTDPRLKAQWDEAKLTAMRRHWPMHELEEIMEEIAVGKALKEAVPPSKVASFLRLTLKDPVVGEMYADACAIRAELHADEIVAIADDDSNDMTFMGTGNAAAVNRSKLRAETRRFLMAAHQGKRYGAHSRREVDIKVTVNHAERLEEARRRKEGVTIDAKTGEVTSTSPPAEDGVFRSFDEMPDEVKRAIGVDPATGLPVEELAWLYD